MEINRKWLLVQDFLRTMQTLINKISNQLGVDGGKEDTNLQTIIVNEMAELVLSGKITDIRVWCDDLAEATVEMLRTEKKITMEKLSNMLGFSNNNALRVWRMRRRRRS